MCTISISIDDATMGTADGSIRNDTRSTTMIGVPLAIYRDGSYVVVVVAEAVEEATVVPEAMDEVEAAFKVDEEETVNNEQKQQW